MWPGWLVLEWSLAAAASLIFWLIVTAEVIDVIRRRRERRRPAAWTRDPFSHADDTAPTQTRPEDRRDHMTPVP